MKQRLTQWYLVSGGLCLAALVGLQLFQRAGTAVAEGLMEPWFALCQALTPDAWQGQGNILLGLGWLISGVVVYSALAGAVVVVLRAAFGRRRAVQSLTQTRPHSDE